MRFTPNRLLVAPQVEKMILISLDYLAQLMVQAVHYSQQQLHKMQLV
jgi:hypothetical protein